MRNQKNTNFSWFIGVLFIIVVCNGDTLEENGPPRPVVNDGGNNLSETGMEDDAYDDENDHDPAKELFLRLFKRRRAEHLEAVKGLLRLDHYERQYKMVTMIAEKIFSVIQNSRVTLESSGYVPGSQFPQDVNVRNALSSILENTALFGDILLRLPDISQQVLGVHHDWEVLLHWSLGFCSETQLLDTTSDQLVHLVTQELGIAEVDPDYVNPYRKPLWQPGPEPNPDQAEGGKQKKKRREIKRGPRLTSSRGYGDL